MVKRQIGIHLLQSPILVLKLLEALDLAYFHAAVAALPFVQCRLAYAQFFA